MKKLYIVYFGKGSDDDYNMAMLSRTGYDVTTGYQSHLISPIKERIHQIERCELITVRARSKAANETPAKN